MRYVMLKCLLVALMLIAPWQSSFAAGDWIVSLHGGQTKVDRLIRSEGQWWNQVDDDSFSFGASLAYDFIPEMGVRLMYERATGLLGANRCPPGQTCPAVAVDEDTDADLWSLAAVPRWYVTSNWSLFGTVGIAKWRLRTDDILPGDSGTDFSYGVGTSWLVTPEFELGLEYQRSEIDHQTLRVNLGWRFGAW